MEFTRESRDHATWLLICLASLFCAAALQAGDYALEPGPLAAAAGLLGLLFLAQGAALRAERWRWLAGAMPLFAQMLAFSVAGVVLSYLAAGAGGPLWDARLLAWDAALGFDRASAFGFLDAAPALATGGWIAYHSLVPQMIVLILALAAAGRLGAARVLLFASTAAGAAAILLSLFLPALGNLYHPAAYPRLGASAAWLHRPDILALREGGLRVLDLASMKGIITFPSYHAALGAIYIWAFWQLPRWRWIGIGWALLTILATPAAGGHYLVDVLAGLALGAAAIPPGRAAVAWDARRLVPAAPALAWRSAGSGATGRARRAGAREAAF
jgi:GNAT superfamily N-acetyltransferase